MAVSMKRVRAALEREEPDYAAAAQLVQTLIQGDDPMLASKASYLASLIQDERTPGLIRQAAQHDAPAIRVAVAPAARNMDAPVASEILVELVADDDPGVRKVARKAEPEEPTDALAQRLEEAPDAAGETPRRPLSPRRRWAWTSRCRASQRLAAVRCLARHLARCRETPRAGCQVSTPGLSRCDDGNGARVRM